MTLRRRQVLLAGGAVLASAGAGLGAYVLSGQAHFADLAQARAAVAALPQQPPLLRGPWNLAQVLNHVAQSIEFSLDGFPQLKPVWFRASVGALAFQVFQARGQMSHPLDQPIPGAPVLDPQAPLDLAAGRLLAAMDRFAQHSGPLHPHFAYGALDKAAYTQAHLMHLANHWTEFQRV